LVAGVGMAGQGAEAGPAIIIMAAGIGRRYGGLKQFAPVGPTGEIILDYSVFDAFAAGFEKLVFVVSEEVEEALRSRMEASLGSTCQVEYVLQKQMPLPQGVPSPPGRRKPWGTGHAVLTCQDCISTPFAVINADDLYGRGSFTTLATYLRQARDRDGLLDLSMVGFPLESTLTEHGQVSRGVCVVDREGYLIEVKERARIEKRDGGTGFLDKGGRWSPIPPGSLASMNMWGFTPGIFPDLQENFREFLGMAHADPAEVEFLLPEAVNQLLVRQRATVRVLPSPEPWSGLTYQADTARARERIAALVDAGVYPRRLWG
jgi:NDP-sugar pyrophosphorylase family protein